MARVQETPEVPAAVPESEVLSRGEEVHESMLNVMKKKFAAEKRVEVRCRNQNSAETHDIFVQVNGYSFLIKPNVKVSVPESLVPILEEGGYL